MKNKIFRAKIEEKKNVDIFISLDYKTTQLQ